MKNHHSIDLAAINIDPQIRPLVELFVKHGIKEDLQINEDKK